jgi:hypothetical protein
MQRVAAWRLANWVGGQIEACLIVLVLDSNSVSFFFFAYPGFLLFYHLFFFSYYFLFRSAPAGAWLGRINQF